MSKKEGHSSGKIFYISQTPDVMGHNCSQNLHMSQEAKAVGHNPTKELWIDRREKTPYFLAQGLNSPMLASVISILDRAAPCFLSCFRLCWPWCSLVLPLFWVSRNLRAAACSTWIVSLADLMEKAIFSNT